MDIQALVNDLVKQHGDKVDTWLTGVFGSREIAEELAKYYVIEEKEPRFEGNKTLNDAHLRLVVTTEYYLRRKTPEEMSHDRANAILAMNTREDPLCIVCKEIITPNDTLVDTIHGKFHGFPKTCIEGHPD